MTDDYVVVDYTDDRRTRGGMTEDEARAWMRAKPHAMRLWRVTGEDESFVLEEACEGEFRSEVPEHPQAERDWFDARLKAAIDRGVCQPDVVQSEGKE